MNSDQKLSWPEEGSRRVGVREGDLTTGAEVVIFSASRGPWAASQLETRGNVYSLESPEGASPADIHAVSNRKAFGAADLRSCKIINVLFRGC